MNNTSNQLMACFVELSENKERVTLEQAIVKHLVQLINCDVYLIHLFDERGEFFPQMAYCSNADAKVDKETRSIEQILVEPEQMLSDYVEQLKYHPPATICCQQPWLIWPLMADDVCIDLILLRDHDPNLPPLALLTAIGVFFTNLMALIKVVEYDSLTGLFNRRMFDTKLSSLINRTVSHRYDDTVIERRHHEFVATSFLAIIDIDYFKDVNDNYGHLFGDEVLLWLAQNMRNCFRSEDALFRYGGEEFAVLISGMEQAEAQQTFERFRAAVAATDFPQVGRITVSIGYSHIDLRANPTVVFGDADKALYYAKQHGRNRVECYQQLVSQGLLACSRTERNDAELF